MDHKAPFYEQVQMIFYHTVGCRPFHYTEGLFAGQESERADLFGIVSVTGWWQAEGVRVVGGETERLTDTLKPEYLHSLFLCLVFLCCRAINLRAAQLSHTLSQTFFPQRYLMSVQAPCTPNAAIQDEAAFRHRDC